MEYCWNIHKTTPVHTALNLIEGKLTNHIQI